MEMGSCCMLIYNAAPPPLVAWSFLGHWSGRLHGQRGVDSERCVCLELDVTGKRLRWTSVQVCAFLLTATDRGARVKLHCTAGKDISHLGETTSVFNPAASEIHGGTVDWW